MEIIGEVTSEGGYPALVTALRSRMGQVTTLENLEHVTGLPEHYASKILGPNPTRALGKRLLGPVLGGLGVKLIMVVDEAALAKVRHRLGENRWTEGRRQAHAARVAAAAVGLVMTKRWKAARRRIRKAAEQARV
jgi:hypothetical protein